MTCQDCGKETEGYDMYCKECLEKSNSIYQAFVKEYDKKIKECNQK